MKNIRSIGQTARTALATPALALLAALPGAHAQLSIGDTSLSYTIDFDTTVAGVNEGVFAGAGFDVVPLPGQLDSDAWAVTGMSTGTLAFGGTQTGGDFARGSAVDTPQTGGGIYAFSGGNITTGVALGIQPVGDDFTPGTLTLRIQNTDTETITGFSFSYLVYVRNDQPRGNTFNFSRSADDVLYSPEASLDLTSPAVADMLGFVSNSRSITLSGLAIAPGSFYYLRWSGDDSIPSGNRDEFALDSIQFQSFTTGVPARTLTWMPITNNWNTTEANWLDDVTPTTFAPLDNAFFTDSGLSGGGAVAVDAGGVTAGNITASHTVDTYTFSGGPINGTGQFAISGGGTVVLTAANGYTGGTVVTGSTLSISNDNQLGGPAGNLTLDNATLLVTANISLAATRSLTALQTITLDIGANTFTVNGPASFATLNLIGAGVMSLAGPSAVVGNVNISEAATINSTPVLNVTGSITATNTTGTVTINAPLNFALARTISAGPSDAAVDLILTGAFTGTGRTTLAGTADSVIRLAGDSNAYAGGFRLSPGGPTIIVAHPNAFGAGQLFLNGGAIDGGIALTGANAVPTPVSLGGSVTFSGQDIEFSGPITFFVDATDPKTLTIAAGQTVTFSGTLDSSGDGNGSINKDGDGKLVIGGTVTSYDETLSVLDGSVDLNTALGSGAASIQATAVLNISASQTIADLTINDGGVVTLSSLPPPVPEFIGGEEFGGAIIGNASVQAVPEPGSAVLLFGGIATLLGVRRRLR